MRKRLLIIPAAAAFLALILALGIPAWLSRGTPVTAAAPDFTTETAWIYRPETEPPAVWEEGWALDFILLPHIPESLDRHGVISTGQPHMRDRMISESANLITLLNRHGAVYIPALRVPTAASSEPDYGPTRADLAAALKAYFETDNRGRAVALVAQDNLAGLLTDISSLLAASGHDNVGDRVVLVLLPDGADTPAEAGLPHLIYAPLPAQPHGTTLAQLMFLPNLPELHDHIPDAEAASAILEGLVANALLRAEEGSRKLVEPFGAIETIEVPPIMRPSETGVPTSTDPTDPPG